MEKPLSGRTDGWAIHSPVRYCMTHVNPPSQVLSTPYPLPFRRCVAGFWVDVSDRSKEFSGISYIVYGILYTKYCNYCQETLDDDTTSPLHLSTLTWLYNISMGVR